MLIILPLLRRVAVHRTVRDAVRRIVMPEGDKPLIFTLREFSGQVILVTLRPAVKAALLRQPVYLDMLPEGDPRDQFHRQYLAAQLTEEAGLVQLAQQQYRMLFRMGLQMMVADWEPSLLEQLEQKFTAEQ